MCAVIHLDVHTSRHSDRFDCARDHGVKLTHGPNKQTAVGLMRLQRQLPSFVKPFKFFREITANHLYRSTGMMCTILDTIDAAIKGTPQHQGKGIL